jgi:hypothetical protein
MQQIGPDFRFKNDAASRTKVPEEPPARAGQIVRQIASDHRVPEQLLARFAARRRRVRHQNTEGRKTALQRANQRFSRPRLPNRHGMHPDELPPFGEMSVPAHPLGQMGEIRGLAPCPPQQAQQRNWQQQVPQQTVGDT